MVTEVTKKYTCCPRFFRMERNATNSTPTATTPPAKVPMHKTGMRDSRRYWAARYPK